MSQQGWKGGGTIGHSTRKDDGSGEERKVFGAKLASKKRKTIGEANVISVLQSMGKNGSSKDKKKRQCRRELSWNMGFTNLRIRGVCCSTPSAPEQGRGRRRKRCATKREGGLFHRGQRDYRIHRWRAV